MELGLSLGVSRPFGFIEKSREASNQSGLGFNFNTSLSIGPVITKQRDQHQHQEQEQIEKQKHKHNSDSTIEEDREATNELLSPSLVKANKKAVLQLDLLPHTPALSLMNPPPHLSFPWHPPLENAGSSSRGLDVKMLPTAENEAEEEAVLSSSPNSAAAASFQMDLCMFSRRGSVSSGEGYDQRGSSSRASDEDENGVDRTRKKLRLSKEQSAFLEESFKEHHTLNPKQKIALAKQLHLRPRQVEVWFQNRRARTKLKQTEADCEYLKKCCDTLTEENRRLQKELQELRALKTSNPFYMQLPATTLTMCPSCERVASNSIDEPTSKAIGFRRFNPSHSTTPQHLELN